jgi:hypothetical protein
LDAGIAGELIFVTKEVGTLGGKPEAVTPPT